MNQKHLPLKQGTTTAYLLQTDNGYLQVDTGYETDYETYQSLLQAKEIPPASIRHLLLTHHHDDHAGYLNQLVRDNPNIRIIAHARSKELLEKGKNNKSNGGGLLNLRIYLLFRLKQLLSPGWDLTFPPFSLRETDILVDQAVCSLPDPVGMEGTVLYTPGHSSDSISLLTPEGNLFCGDLASNFLNWAGAHHATLFNENMEAVYASWQQVLARGARRIFPAHGEPFEAKILEKEMKRYQTADLWRFF